MRLPERFQASMRELLGSEFDTYEKCLDQPSAHGLRVNTGKITAEDFQKLTPFSLTKVPWVQNGFYYDCGELVTKHPHYYAGLYYVQEPSAMIPASRLPVERGDRVLDLCAAPGGKATELAARLSGTGLLVANDRSNSRAKGLLKNLELFGAGNILVTSEEPGRLLRYFPGFFDKILVDAPCSGEGMFRRDPSMIRDWEEKGPSYYAPIQREILRTAAALLAPGGQLLYSTCTFSRTEDEENVSWLLDTVPELTLRTIEGCEGFSASDLPGCVRVFPHRVRGEGHFAALFQKAGVREAHLSDGNGRKPEKLPQELLDFLKDIPSVYEKRERITLRDGRAYLMPEGLPGIKGLRFLRTGLLLGECRKNRFEPSQALAMFLKKEEYPRTLSIPASDTRLLRYLKGETLEAEGELKKGWVLVCVDGYPLGWGKAGGGRIKNKYYPGWRIQ